MTRKKIFILLGNSDKETFSGELADAYQRGARNAGHAVRRLNIGELAFDPVLHKGYKIIQPLEPDLINVQKHMTWADHVVIIYPNWWHTMPAVLKGMFDRMWLPGFAFNFDKITKKRVQRLSGKSARVIVIAGTHSPFITRFKYGDFTNEIERGILQFAGISPVRVTCFGPSDRHLEERKKRWTRRVSRMGERAR